MPVNNSEREKVWEEVRAKHPLFTEVYDAAGNYHAVREIVLGGSVTWAGVWQRFTPKPEMRIMDVGANAGIFSAFCALHGAAVVAYEPFEDAYNLLRKVEIGLPRIIAINMAIWRNSGICWYLGNKSTLEDSPAYNGSLRTNGINWNDGDITRAVMVPCVSLDDAIAGKTWEMVKMDIEGAECEVLLAASLETLRRIKFMYLEFHPWVSEALYKETVARLESVYRFEGAYWSTELGRWEAAYLSLQ